MDNKVSVSDIESIHRLKEVAGHPMPIGNMQPVPKQAPIFKRLAGLPRAKACTPLRNVIVISDTEEENPTEFIPRESTTKIISNSSN